MSTVTYTDSYTVVDIGRVVSSFAADYHMIAQATALVLEAHVRDVVHDVRILAEHEYIRRVDVVLLDQQGRTVRGASYTVSMDASLWETSRPGASLWPRLVSGSLVVVLSWSVKWKNEMGAAERWGAFKREHLRIPWGPSGIDLLYPGLSKQVDRRYASKAYGMERTSYR